MLKTRHLAHHSSAAQPRSHTPSALLLEQANPHELRWIGYCGAPPGHPRAVRMAPGIRHFRRWSREAGGPAMAPRTNMTRTRTSGRASASSTTRSR